MPRGRPEADRRVNLGSRVGGLLLAFARLQGVISAAALGQVELLDDLRELFCIRLGLMIAAVGLAYLWEQRPSAGRRWSPLQAAGPILAVRLLDPRRAGLRADFTAFHGRFHPQRRLDRAGVRVPF